MVFTQTSEVDEPVARGHSCRWNAIVTSSRDLRSLPTGLAQQLLIALRAKLHAAAEDVIDTAGVEQHERHADQRDDKHHGQGVGR